ncbi:MAG: OmpA family protein [Candidatus Competibacteraceae bacterium]|nr:OmpA family protein [Candidatus Competibacteraceae bacterium]
MNKVLTIICCIALFGVTACAVDDPYRRTKAGAGIGAVAGAVIGHQIDGKSGRYVGAAVGALAGGAAGNYMDRQQQAFDQALAEEQNRYNMEVQRMQDGSLKLNIPSEVSFDVDRADIKPAFVPTLDKVANILQEYNQSTIDIIGHTDSSGSDDYNLELSLRRAESVANYLASRGVAPQRLRTDGRGKREPRASNATASGRQLNRRVEMIVRPTEQGQYQQPTGGYSAPPQQGGGYGDSPQNPYQQPAPQPNPYTSY